jgi:hypothetical protein
MSAAQPQESKATPAGAASDPELAHATVTQEAIAVVPYDYNEYAPARHSPSVLVILAVIFSLTAAIASIITAAAAYRGKIYIMHCT